jgi:hypothetical protein
VKAYRLKKTTGVLVAGKETGLEVNVEKTKYVLMCHERNAEQNHSIKIRNKSLGRVAEFKYVRTAVTN